MPSLGRAEVGQTTGDEDGAIVEGMDYPGGGSGLRLDGKARIADLRLEAEATGSKMWAPAVQLELAAAGSDPLRNDYHIKELLFERPEVQLGREADGKLGLIAPAGASGDQTAAAKKKTGNPLALLVDRLTVKEGKLAVLDRNGSPEAGKLWTVQTTVTDLSLASDRAASFVCDFGNEDQTHISAQGTLAHSPFVAEGYARSEERRVGKECRSRWSPYH